MKLLKPTWISHGGQPIFSVDIHPDGSRFATGGQGESRIGKIVIWNMEPVREEENEKDERVPKILCQMENHLTCVNCVRWSSDGKYLASAGDDKLIMIWQASRQPSMSCFGSKVANVESWGSFSTLRGHSGDILSVAWSSNDAWLASCSVDNVIIIWNAQKFPEQIAMLKEHEGIIKGVAWDPVGSYLASQCDDKTVRIWRTYDWKLETCIKEPFKECGGTTQVLRLDWSPDGECIVTAHALNNSGPIAQIISRNGWKTNLDFVGHRRAVTCVRFSPRIMEKVQSNGTKSKDYVVCAIGSKDRSISIWATCYKRPLVVIHDLFKEEILDITWASNGSEMLCCSWDGTVAYFGFSPEEIGTPLSQQEKVAIHMKLYGKTVLAGNSGVNHQDNLFIESVEFLQAMENGLKSQVDCNSNGSKLQEKQNSRNVESDALKIEHSTNTSSPMKSTNRQIETRTKDGKRKITPIFIAPQPDFGGVPLPYSSFPQLAPQFSTDTQTSTIIVEKKDPETMATIPEVSRIKENSVPQNEVQVQNNIEDSSAIHNSQNNTQQNDRSQPMEVSPCEQADAQNKSTAPTSVSLNENQLRSHVVEGADDIKRKKDGRGRPRKDKLMETSTRTPSNTNIQVIAPSTPTSSMVQPSYVAEMYHTTNVFSLPHLKRIQGTQSHTVQAADKSERPFMVENIARPPSDWQPPALVRCRRESTVLWESMLPSPIISSCATEQFYSVICEDNTLHTFTIPCGRPIFPCIQLKGAPSLFQAFNHFVMVVSTLGCLSLWDLRSLKCLIKNESVEHLFKGDIGSISKSWITEDGVPIIVLSIGRAYSYSKDMECWILLSSKKDSIITLSDNLHCKSGYLESIIPKIKPAVKTMMLHKSDNHSREVATVTHLEKQMACSLALNLSSEYREWMKLYARRLMHNGMETKLRSLCQELLTPLHSRKYSSNKTVGFTLSFDNMVLLKELLDLMKDFPAFQRMYNEFHSQIKELEGLDDL